MADSDRRVRLQALRRLVSMLLTSTVGSAAAAEAAKDPLSYPMKQYLLMLGTALLGGLVSWYAKVKRGDLRGWNVMQLVGELATSAFAGLLCFWLCEYANTPQLVTVSLVGIAGHMGTRAISAFEDRMQRHFSGGAAADKTPPPKGP